MYDIRASQGESPDALCWDRAVLVPVKDVSISPEGNFCLCSSGMLRALHRAGENFPLSQPPILTSCRTKPLPCWHIFMSALLLKVGACSGIFNCAGPRSSNCSVGHGGQESKAGCSRGVSPKVMQPFDHLSLFIPMSEMNLKDNG